MADGTPAVEPLTGAVVVFDLDGTLAAGDAFGGFLGHSLRRDPLRGLLVVLTAPVWGFVGLRRPGR
jgi:hypothetical protein